MQLKHWITMIALTLTAFAPISGWAQTLPAFPGAVGYGAAATGGRGGAVYHVTNLNDSGAGSFRDAVSASNRIIVFDVGGYIVLSSAVSVKSNITIAGQTAPGDGIGVMGREVSFNAASNVIVRYFRFRQGDLDPDSGKSGINLLNATNIILDHVSIEFAQWNNIDAVGCADITVQNSIDADPIGQQFNAHTESVGEHFTWYRNLLANAHNRSPLAKINDQYINNVVYNYQAGYTTGNTGTGFSHDIINNYFLAGPSTTSSGNYFFQMGDAKQKYYISGNLADTSGNGTLGGSSIGYPGGGVTRLSAPFAPTTATIPTLSAPDAYAFIVANAGALPRDDVDADVIKDLTSLGTRGHMWTHQTSTGLTNSGYGTLSGGMALQDTDGDGMPDAWERQYGLDPTDSFDALTDFDGTGYRNIEKYFNGLVDGSYPIGSPVDLSGKFNGVGVTTDGTPNAGGMDGAGGAFSSDYLNTTLTTGRYTFNIGGPDTGNVVGAFGQTVLLPLGKGSLLTLLATSSHGTLTNQKFTVRYTDGTVGTFIQTLSGWASPVASNTGEALGLTMAFKNTLSGANQLTPVFLYQYNFALNPQKTVRSLTLPNKPGLSVFAITMVPAAPIVQSGLIYKLIPQHAQSVGEVLDVTGGSAASGTNVEILTGTNALSQQWLVTDMGGGYWRLTPQCAPANALDVAAGGNVDSAAWTGSAAQLWKILDLGTGYAELSPQSNETLALDVAGVRTADGTNVDAYRYGNGTNQHWKLALVIPIVKPGTTYRLVPKNATALALTVTGGGSVVDVETIAASSTSQQWTLTDAGGGYFRMTPVSAPAFGLTVMSTSNSAAPTSEVYTGASGQLWSFIDLGNGVARIKPKSDIDANLNGALDVAGSRTASGSTVVVYQIAAGATGGTNEQWQLVRVK